MKKVKLGVIGVGGRGKGMVADNFLCMNELEVVSVCDVYEDRVEDIANIIKEKTGSEPHKTVNYKEVIDNPDVEAVYISTSWDTHVDISVYAMNAGKAVALEVGGAYDIDDCWRLVDTYEKTKTPFMFMENCCFGRREMMVLNMVKKGLFGEVVHCQGGYQHDLRNEIAFGRENRHYRLDNYLNRNCENYPTHELGPIAKILDINHGNRFLYLTSVSSNAAGLRDYIKVNKPDDEVLNNAKFRQGDIVTTNIKCANGETITIQLDTTLPRYYSRGFTIRGTKAMFEEGTDSVFLDTEEDRSHDFDWREKKSGNAAEFEEEYDHPVWKDYIESGVYGSHDGMDMLEFMIFADCLTNNKPMPVDVYDAACWMVVSTLSEQSISTGSAPVAFPDFTRGKWVKK